MLRSRPISSGVLGRMMSVSSVYSYIYCLLLSNALVGLPLFGGALYLTAQVGQVFFTTYAGQRRALLPRTARLWHTALLCVLMVISLSVVVIYPFRLHDSDLWLLFAVVLAMLIRDGFGMRLVDSYARGGFKRSWFIAVFILLHLVPALALMWIDLVWLPPDIAWQYVDGYALCALAAAYSQYKELAERRALAKDGPQDEEKLNHLRETLREANAFRVFEKLSALITVGLQLTMALLYTQLAVASYSMVTDLAVGIAVSFVCREAAEIWYAHRRANSRYTNPTNILLVGLFLWLFGLNTFRRALRGGVDLPTIYLCLGLCTGGMTLCATVCDWLERAMVDVAHFVAGRDLTGLRSLRTATLQLSSLLGQMGALLLLTLVTVLTGQRLPWSQEPFSLDFRPILLLPALLTVLAAVIFTFRFPLSTRTLDKLTRFLRMQEEGGENAALEKQLQRKVVGSHSQAFVTSALKVIIRRVYRHRLVGVQRIRPNTDNPIIFLCNHGELYGPMIAVSYLPVPVRAWSISNIMGDPEKVFQYIYKYTFKDNQRFPRPIRAPLARVVARLCVWAMNQLECIPVYRDQPGQLIKTFRESVEAMQAGDNLLIFPENPNAQGQDHGYEQGGLGELFSGFAMLAPVYYNRTGKCCRFLPMYANKQTRVITFGEEIVYRPGSDRQEEAERIARETREQMEKMMNESR